MDIGGLGSQADADRKKAARESKRSGVISEEERGKQERHRRRMEALMEQQLKEQAKTNDALFNQGELLQRLLNEMLKGQDGKAIDKRVKFEWQARMTKEEKLDREALWIPLTMNEVPRVLVQSNFKMLVKQVHSDLNPGIGDEAFIALKAAHDRMLKRAV